MNPDHLDPDFISRRVEFALGTLDGRQRAELAAHVNECLECSRDIANLVNVVDDLTLAAPDGEPSGGFESRVLASIAAEGAPPHSRRWGVLLAAAAALVVVSATLGAILASPGVTPSASAAVVERPLWSHHQKVGTIYAQLGAASWMVVVSSQRSREHFVDCVGVTTTGRVVNLGGFSYGTGFASWSVGLPVPAKNLREIRLESPSGTVVATSGTSGWSGWSGGAS